MILLFKHRVSQILNCQIKHYLTLQTSHLKKQFLNVTSSAKTSWDVKTGSAFLKRHITRMRCFTTSHHENTMFRDVTSLMAYVKRRGQIPSLRATRSENVIPSWRILADSFQESCQVLSSRRPPKRHPNHRAHVGRRQDLTSLSCLTRIRTQFCSSPRTTRGVWFQCLDAP